MLDEPRPRDLQGWLRHRSTPAYYRALDGLKYVSSFSQFISNMSNQHDLEEVFCGESPTVDIIAVHGLMGNPRKTWTCQKTKTFWLGDAKMLPAHMKNARILTYGYNADVFAFVGTTSSDTILHHAHTMIATLVADRQLHDATSRPIIFLCHSLGGIIVKRALVYAASCTSRNLVDNHSIFTSTYAILFLGTPHNGSSKAHLASTARKVISLATPSKLIDTSGQLLRALDVGSEVLQHITDAFTPLMKEFRLFFFWEQNKTDFGFKKDYVVEEGSAAPLHYDARRAGLPYDHRGMTKFGSPSSPGYPLVVAALKGYASEAPDVIKRRQDHAQRMIRAKREEQIAELQAFSEHI